MSTKEFMEEAAKEKPTDVIFNCKNKRGYELILLRDSTVTIRPPNPDIVGTSYHFDTQEDWENFCEATWETEHYVGIRKEHFVEMFEALMFVESYHKNRLSQARLKFDAVSQEIKEQEHGLRQLRNIVERYEEVYSENKVQ